MLPAVPTKAERAIADAQVQANSTAIAMFERRLNDLRLPDGVVSVIAAEAGENVRVCDRRSWSQYAARAPQS